LISLQAVDHFFQEGRAKKSKEEQEERQNEDWGEGGGQVEK